MTHPDHGESVPPSKVAPLIVEVLEQYEEVRDEYGLLARIATRAVAALESDERTTRVEERSDEVGIARDPTG